MAQKQTSSSVGVPAHKGSLVILRQVRMYNNLLMGAYAGSERYVPAIVAAASCSGRVLKVEPRFADGFSSPQKLDARDDVMVVPEKRLGGMDVRAVALSLEPSYDTLTEVRGAILAATAPAPLVALRHYVTGAIERGETTAITEVRA